MTKVNVVYSTHGVDRSFAISANPILATVQITFDVLTKLTMLAAIPILTGTRLNVKVGSIGIAALATIDAKVVAIRIFFIAIVAERHWKVASRSNKLGHGVFVERGVAIADELIVAILIHALNANSSIAVVKKKERDTKDTGENFEHSRLVQRGGCVVVGAVCCEFVRTCKTFVPLPAPRDYKLEYVFHIEYP